jgi:hypothetical protein
MRLVLPPSTQLQPSYPFKNHFEELAVKVDGIGPKAGQKGHAADHDGRAAEGR